MLKQKPFFLTFQTFADWVEGYPWYKSIFCFIIVLRVKQMMCLCEEKESFFLKIFWLLCFWWIHKLEILWHHHRHYCTLEVTLSIVSLESYVISKWNVFRNQGYLWQTFATFFRAIVKDGNQFQTLSWFYNAIAL